MFVLGADGFKVAGIHSSPTDGAAKIGQTSYGLNNAGWVVANGGGTHDGVQRRLASQDRVCGRRYVAAQQDGQGSA